MFDLSTDRQRGHTDRQTDTRTDRHPDRHLDCSLRQYLVQSFSDGCLLSQGTAHEAHELMEKGHPPSPRRQAGLLAGWQGLHCIAAGLHS